MAQLNEEAIKCFQREVHEFVASGNGVSSKDVMSFLFRSLECSPVDQNIVQYLVEHGADVNGKNVDGMTVLQCAVKSGSLHVVRYLVEHGAKVNEKSTVGMTVLQYAVLFRQLNTVIYLTERVEDVNEKGLNGMTALHCAVQCRSTSIVKYLVQHGADVNGKDSCGITVLQYTVLFLQPNIAEYLVQNGSDVNGKNCVGMTVLQYAVQSGSPSLVKFFLDNGADVNGRDDDGVTVLQYAVQSCLPYFVKSFPDNGAEANSENDDDVTVIERAVQFGPQDIVKYLVNRGADVNGEDQCGKRVLHYAVLSGSLDIIKCLLENGADVNGKCGTSYTSVLQLAVQYRLLHIVKCLVEVGADVNSGDSDGMTALHHAVVSGSLDIVKLLVEHGADVNGKDGEDVTVLQCAVQPGSPDIVRYLIEQGADVCSESAVVISKRKSTRVQEFGLESDFKSHSLVFLFAKMAIEKNSVDLIKLLIQKGIDFRKIDEMFEESMESLLELSTSLVQDEITNIIKLELKKSVKHREKIRKLKSLIAEEIGPPLKYFVADHSLAIGSGSIGTSVYVGILEDDSEVAVKRMLKQACRDAAENERTILSLITTKKSPFIVSYQHFLADQHFMYLIVDLCEETLEQHVNSFTIEYFRQHGPRMIKEILAGLEVLHDQRILHRDLKPSNVLVDVNGHMKLADFGISRVLNDNATTVYTDPRGTRDWMPAEVIETDKGKKCRFKKKSDVQVAGMVSFFILTKGEHPFGSSLERMINIAKGQPVNLQKLNHIKAQGFVQWLISHNIDDRPYAHEALRHTFLTDASHI